VNVPDPPDHVAPVATDIDPFRAISALLAQNEAPVPASTVGSGVMVIVIWSVTGVQFPFPVVVKVRVTLHAAISPRLGV
jgi:hypothetical protein